MATIQEFAELVEREQREAYREAYRRAYRPLCQDIKNFDLLETAACRAWVETGKKYTKVNVGDSAKYMVEDATGIIYGVKGYGVVHKGHAYGTLDTVHEWNWGGYHAGQKKTPQGEAKG